MLVYTTDGELLADRTIGGESGSGPGQFNFVTDVAQDTHGNYYIAEYGEFDRVQKFTRDGKFLMQWGRHGSELGEFLRPQSIMLDAEDRLWVADSCNHRVQVFETTDKDATLVKSWGQEGSELGQLRYPYGLQLDGEGMSISASTATTACRSSRSTASWSVGGGRTDAKRASSASPGPRSSTAVAGCTCWIVTTTACSGSGSEWRY